MRRLPIVIVLILCWMLPAQADWQFAKWNMTRDELIAASGGGIHAVTGGPKQRRWELDLGAEGTYSDGDFNLKSQFFFDKAGRFKAMSLGLDAQRCGEYREHLLKVYGKPTGRAAIGGDENASVFWRDEAHDNLVRLNSFRGLICFAVFAPLEAVDENGVPHFK